MFVKLASLEELILSQTLGRTEIGARCPDPSQEEQHCYILLAPRANEKLILRGPAQCQFL